MTGGGRSSSPGRGALAIELALLAAVVLSVYVVLVAGVGRAIGTDGRPNRGLALAATVIVALSAPRIRNWSRRVAHRLLGRDTVTPHDVSSDVARRMGSVLSIDDVLPALADMSARVARAPKGEVRLLLPNGEVEIAASSTDPVDGGVAVAVEVIHDGAVIGHLAATKLPSDPPTPNDQRLLRALADQAGLALETVRLTTELRNRLAAITARSEELRSSRARLVVARDGERRRLEREIQDRVQRQLRQARRRLTAAGRAIEGGDVTAADANLAFAEAKASAAHAALRDLARGVFPPLLFERGLVAALEAFCESGPTSIRLRCDDEVRLHRVPPDVEAAVYFGCVEAVRLARWDNAAADISISVVRTAKGVDVDVRSTSRGRDRKAMGGSLVDGLEVVSDRVGALGGRLLATVPEAGSLEVWLSVPVAVSRRRPPTTTSARRR